MNNSCLIQHANKHCLIIAFVYLLGGAEKFYSPIVNYDFWSFDLILKSGSSRELSALLISENQGVRLSVSNKVVNLIIWPNPVFKCFFSIVFRVNFPEIYYTFFSEIPDNNSKILISERFSLFFFFFFGRKIYRWNHELLCLLFQLLSLWSGLEWSN